MRSVATVIALVGVNGDGVIDVVVVEGVGAFLIGVDCTAHQTIVIRRVVVREAERVPILWQAVFHVSPVSG